MFFKLAMPHRARSILSGNKPNLPPYHFDFGWIVVPDHDKYLEKCFAQLDLSGLRVQQVRRLRRSLWDALIPRPPDLHREPIGQLLEEAEGHPGLLKRIVHRAAKRFRDLSFDRARLTLHVTRHKDEDAVISLESNLAELLGIPDGEAHKLWQSSLMGLAGILHRLAEMKGYEALSGFTDEDVDLFLDKVAFIVDPGSVEKHEAQLERVIRIAQLPIFEPANDRPLNVDALFKVRQSSELKDFRAWLASAGERSDAEIREQLGSVRSRLGNLIDSTIGKTLKFLALSGIGIASASVGVAMSGLDTFLTEKLLPRSGVLAFISKKYPLLFKKDNVSRVP